MTYLSSQPETSFRVVPRSSVRCKEMIKNLNLNSQIFLQRLNSFLPPVSHKYNWLIVSTYFQKNHCSKKTNLGTLLHGLWCVWQAHQRYSKCFLKGFKVGHALWSMYFQVLNLNPKSKNPTRMVYQDFSPRVCVVVYHKGCVLVLPIILCKQ